MPNSPKNCQRYFTICQSGKILPNLVTLDLRCRHHRLLVDFWLQMLRR